jgi:hypothetical protein
MMLADRVQPRAMLLDWWAIINIKLVGINQFAYLIGC